MEDTVRIVILGRDDTMTPIVYNYLAKQFKVSGVILEEQVSGLTVLKRRAKRLGAASALGQGLFVKLVMPFLLSAAKKRIADIIVEKGLKTTAVPTEKRTLVSSVNDDETLKTIADLRPTHIVVNGTRLIDKAVLDQLTIPIINIHLGWNPRYRGGNGGYWALWNNDSEHCGVTVHLIDPGIDTGAILERRVIHPTRADSFMTYPYLQLAAGLRAFTERLQSGDLSTQATQNKPSRVWYHPTIWG